MLAAEPSLATLYSTKSGSKRIFAMADVNAPPGAHDIYEEAELHAALTKLVAANTHVKRWIFKVRHNRCWPCSLALNFYLSTD